VPKPYAFANKAENLKIAWPLGKLADFLPFSGTKKGEWHPSRMPYLF
jgi:hypothetical protein